MSAVAGAALRPRSPTTCATCARSAASACRGCRGARSARSAPPTTRCATRSPGRNYVADYVQTLTHELKSPLSAIRGAAELLREPMSEADRQRFLANIARETQRIQELVDRMMELTALESRRSLDAARAGRAAPAAATSSPPAPRPPARRAACASSARRRRRRARRRRRVAAAPRGRQPARQRDRLLAGRRHGHARAHAAAAAASTSPCATAGPGIPDYAEDKVFEKFYSLARPHSQQEEHRARPVVRQGDRRAAPGPRDACAMPRAAVRWRRCRCRAGDSRRGAELDGAPPDGHFTPTSQSPHTRARAPRALRTALRTAAPILRLDAADSAAATQETSMRLFRHPPRPLSRVGRVLLAIALSLSSRRCCSLPGRRRTPTTRRRARPRARTSTSTSNDPAPTACR